MSTDFSGIYAREIYPVIKRAHFGGDKAGNFAAAVLLKSGAPTDGRILEVCCGDGTDALTMSNYGFQVDLLDSSKELLSQAGRKLWEKQKHVRTILANVVDDWVEPRMQYDAVVCLMSFCLIENPYKFVANVSRSLCSGGIFVFDYRNRNAIRNTDGRSVRDEEIGGIRRTVSEEICTGQTFSGIRVARYVYVHVGRTIHVAHTSFLHTLKDILGFLDHNLDLAVAYSGFELKPANFISDTEITIVARKK